MGLGGIIAGAMGGLGQGLTDVGQSQMALLNQQALEQQRSDLAATKAQNLIDYNLAAQDRERQQTADRIQAAAAPAIQQQVLTNAQADPDNEWVAADAKVNPDGTAIAGTPTVTPSMSDLSPADLAQYAPTQQQRMGIIANAAVSTNDVAPAAQYQGYTQLLGQEHQDKTQLAAQNFQTQAEINRENFQSGQQANQIKATADNQSRQLAAMADRATGTASDPSIALGTHLLGVAHQKAIEVGAQLKAVNDELSATRPTSPNYAPLAASAAQLKAEYASLDNQRSSIALQLGKKTGLDMSAYLPAPASAPPMPARTYDPTTGTFH